jgi:hypothetical protein
MRTMQLSWHAIVGRGALEASRTDEKYTDETRRFVRKHLVGLERAGVPENELAAAKEAGDAAVAYVDTLEQMGASPDVVKVAADAGRKILEEKHPQAVSAGS